MRGTEHTKANQVLPYRSFSATCEDYVFTISYAESIADDLASIRAFERRHLLEQIDRQLSHEPTRETRNRKILRGLTPPWEHVEPIWELRVNQYRVFYDVDKASEQVVVRAVRHKPPHKTTEEIL